MDFITLIRIVIWLTFFLLIIEGITALVLINRFHHRQGTLEARIEALEKRQ